MFMLPEECSGVQPLIHSGQSLANIGYADDINILITPYIRFTEIGNILKFNAATNSEISENRKTEMYGMRKLIKK